MSKRKRKKSSRPKSSASKLKKENRGGLTRIKVVGVGGGGGNAVSRMMASERPRGVEFIAINTDAQDLDYVTAHKKIYIGKALTRGLGAGMNPEIGKQAAEENRSEIGEALEGSDIVFITAGMGGGTGTSGSAVVAEIAKEKGILTIAVVTKPFTFEGAQRTNIAQEGLSRLKEKVDALVVIPNDRIFSIIDKDTPILKAFSAIDEVLKQSVRAITELVNAPGIINVDFADVKTILKDAGPTLIGIGTAGGQDRAMKAVNMAVNSPLLEVSLEGAKGVVFSIAGSKDLKMSEINDIAKSIAANLDNNARVIFGAYHDRTLKDKALKVTVIATGFNGAFSQRPMIPTLFISADNPKKETKLEFNQEKANNKEENLFEDGEKNSRVGPHKADKNEPWDIPAFLRKKKK
jgi:cell division protein FtsZ